MFLRYAGKRLYRKGLERALEEPTKSVHGKADLVKAPSATQRFVLRWALPGVRILALPRDRAVFILQQVRYQPASLVKMVPGQGKGRQGVLP